MIIKVNLLYLHCIQNKKIMYKFLVFILIVSLVLYYTLCFLEIFKVIKFTTNGINPAKLLIPFYYLFK